MKRSLIVLFSFAAAIVIGEKLFFNDSIDCRAAVTYHHADRNLSIAVKQQLHDGKGIVTVSGVLYEDGKEKDDFSKAVSYTYTRNGHFYVMKSTKIIDSPHMTMSEKEQGQWLPLFFTVPGGEMNMEMKPNGIAGWIVSGDSVPLYYCENFH